ncbi:tRNA (adenosine(37)-N6)-threonylcarbamoyltransferase complex dimerization subunit type 1 TsaB [Paracraurococcus ruber]|uniref:tRNA (Adenosine(37)-N6)-threonylcarbamoyltransferase complex dimerization subunit type 1 TsaB n=1 Tax=Paracraurococcus ruber TaxID=77675 RepID=A0ABS1D6L3_9PROT|nr:tRNA (adenosine(37)-N6)-threonylcarbamoyltransferase complex dimerization subunit type 1 TsaB [Paracraurococcus ruber]
MWILALDASLACCSAALLADGVLRGQRSQAGDRGHAAALPPMVQAVLRDAGARPADLDAVAAVVGPGGFTGIRAALALAQGIALAAGVPLLGVTTGEALAEALPADQRRGRAVWSVVDNRRGRVVLERFAAGGLMPEAGSGPEVQDIAGLPLPAGPVALVGDAAEAVAAALLARGRGFRAVTRCRHAVLAADGHRCRVAHASIRRPRRYGRCGSRPVAPPAPQTRPAASPSTVFATMSRRRTSASAPSA